MTARLLALLTLFGMTACSAAPENRYYTLSAIPSSGNASPVVARGTVAIDAVTIPDMLARPQIVVRTGANEVEVLEFDRWAGELSDQLRSVLTADLAARLGSQSIRDSRLPANPQTGRRITIDILAFDPAQTGQLVLDASWTLSDATPGSSPGSARTYRTQHAIPSQGRAEPAQLVAAMSGLLGSLSDDIAASLSPAA